MRENAIAAVISREHHCSCVARIGRVLVFDELIVHVFADKVLQVRVDEELINFVLNRTRRVNVCWDHVHRHGWDAKIEVAGCNYDWRKSEVAESVSACVCRNPSGTNRMKVANEVCGGSSSFFSIHTTNTTTTQQQQHNNTTTQTAVSQ